VNNDGKFIRLDSHTASAPDDAKYNFIFHDGVVLPGVKDDGSPNDILICAQDYYSRMFWKGDMAVSEDVVYKSDYIALRQVYLTYRIPERLSGKLGLHNTQISAFGSNLGYLHKALPNASPESTMGTNSFTERAASAMVRMVGLELKFTF
jgi:iron complex outermembrane receptor protein